MKKQTGGAGKNFGKRDKPGAGKKNFGKSEGKPLFFKKEEKGGDDAKPKRRSYTSADFGGEDKKTSRSNSYTRSFDAGSDSRTEKKPRKDFGDKYGDKKSSFKKEGDSSYSDKPRKDYGDKKPAFKKGGDSSYDKPRKDYGDKKPSFKKEEGSYDKPRKDYGDKPRKDPGDKKFSKRNDDFSYEEKPRSKGGSGSYSKKGKGDGFDESSYERKPKKDSDSYRNGDKKPYGDKKSSGDKKPFGEKRSFGDKKPFGKKDFSYEEGSSGRKPGKFAKDKDSGYEKKGKKDFGENGKRPRIAKKSFAKSNPANDGLIRLNKYISNSGVCSRREADKLIESGAVTVNGKIVAELGFKVSPDDVITYGGQAIKREKKVYVLLNKPKDYITTLDDPEGRKTVMELLKNTGKERIYPVGRLDRNTTGLLMLTNDGEMAMKLTHPKHNIQKMYAVDIDKGIKPEDLKALKDGFELEDGFIKADHVELVGEGTNRKEIGIEIHSGRNRIVRRMFEHLGYNVIRLDRVMFAGLTKKDLPRGKWRFLSEKEVSFLKMI
jgi:23S rRNA pseudouridine2605 synthase